MGAKVKGQQQLCATRRPGTRPMSLSVLPTAPPIAQHRPRVLRALRSSASPRFLQQLLLHWPLPPPASTAATPGVSVLAGNVPPCHTRSLTHTPTHTLHTRYPLALLKTEADILTMSLPWQRSLEHYQRKSSHPKFKDIMGDASTKDEGQGYISSSGCLHSSRLLLIRTSSPSQARSDSCSIPMDLCSGQQLPAATLPPDKQMEEQRGPSACPTVI